MSEAVLYLSDCVDECFLRGSTTIPADDVRYLIEAVDALKWYDVDEVLPENLSINASKKVIPCLVAVAPPKSQPNRKPRVTVAQRQFDRYYYTGWVWSRSLDVLMWRPLPEV